MGLSGPLSRLAVRHAHVLVVETPGHWLTRVAVERQILDRGWRLAWSPADADVLAVCGPPGPELAEVVARLWDQFPGPRARIEVGSPDAAETALRAAGADLLDVARQQADSRHRTAGRGGAAPAEHHGAHGQSDDGGGRQPAQSGRAPAPEHHPDQELGGDRRAGGQHVHPGGHGNKAEATHGGTAGPGHERDEHGDTNGGGHAGHGMDQGGHAYHGGMAHDGMDHGGHGGMEHGRMAPGGIPLANGGEDRDGLEMDVLHVRLGPVLPYWPAGLVLRCALQGDVIVEAVASLVDVADVVSGHDREAGGGRRHAARRCDNAASLLALAGWEDGVARARRIRDALLLDGDATGPAADLDRLRRSVRRSWPLRWSLRRLGPLAEHEVIRRHLPGHLRGDARDRLLGMLDRAARSLAGGTEQRVADRPGTTPVEAIADVVRGWDLATARLIVASLDLDPWPADREVSHV